MRSRIQTTDALLETLCSKLLRVWYSGHQKNSLPLLKLKPLSKDERSLLYWVIQKKLDRVLSTN